MSTSNEISDLDRNSKSRMKPAVRRIFCCSVTAASGFVAAYALVAYAIALIYEIVWVVESEGGLPIPSTLLMACYCIVIAATVALVHGLISKNNKCLLAWLVTVILVLIPECALVFYMSISHWGLQGVYGGAELACYVARLPAIVIGVVLVQSAYAIREARSGGYSNGVVNASGSEFDASHYVPDGANAFTNDGFTTDNGKPGSMPDLRRHLPSRQSINLGYPPMMLPPPPAYWQHLADRQYEQRYAASLRGYPKPYPQMYGTWMGPRQPMENPYKRRHSVVGAFDEYPHKDFDVYEDRNDCKSEMGYYRYDPRFDPRVCPPEYDPRYGYDFKRDEHPYGVNLMRHDPYLYAGGRYYGTLRNSQSMGNESDDLGKYKDVAL